MRVPSEDRRLYRILTIVVDRIERRANKPLTPGEWGDLVRLGFIGGGLWLRLTESGRTKYDDLKLRLA